ncbi:MAG: DUF58 domain-containing protein [Akkermansia sp.]|nr:DUF58 domain-containing protein [Akkermansia sp.]
MDKAQNILRQVRRIELNARKLATAGFLGQYRSGFRGQGLDFDDFREYLPGDEPRFIDWKVTARTGTPYVKKFREDREQVLLLAVDTSASMRYASEGCTETKLEYAARLAAVLGYSAARNGDKCGLLLFGRRFRFFLTPDKGMKQTLRIIREILSSPPAGEDASMNGVADEILHTQRKRALLFLISDFLMEADKSALGRLAFRHELIPVRVADSRELELPEAGRVVLRDPEGGAPLQIDLRRPELIEAHRRAVTAHREAWERDIRRLGLDFVDLHTHQDFIPPLRGMFARRSRLFAR